VAIGLEQVSST